MLKKLLQYAIDNPVMANIVTLALIGFGLYSAFTIVRNLLPEMRPRMISVVTKYPGGSPEDIERGVTEKIEDKIEDVDGVDKIYSTTIEGLSSVRVELKREANIDRVINDVKNAVDTIDDFPEEAEEPIVSRLDLKWHVLAVAIYGDMNEKELKRQTDDIEDEIRKLIGINDTQVYGLPEEQINIDVSPEKLEAYHLSLLDIVRVVSKTNFDLPGGMIRTARANLTVRTLGERRTADDIKKIIVRASPDGKMITISQVGKVVDGFVDNDLYGRFMGKPAASIMIFRATDQDAIRIAEKIRAYLAGKMGRPIPKRAWLYQLIDDLGYPSEVKRIYRQARQRPLKPNVKLAVYDDVSRYVKDRLDLLKRNGKWGLMFVFLSLLIFLNRWVAFWVMSGVLLSILGALIVLKHIGLTLNLVSMFGLIVALGLLVDDAIVIGESIFRRTESGESPKLAALNGTQEVAIPVVIAVLTTICAFVPLTMIKGRIGDFIRILPIVASAALLISLVEALWLLPSHLAEFIPARFKLNDKNKNSNVKNADETGNESNKKSDAINNKSEEINHNNNDNSSEGKTDSESQRARTAIINIYDRLLSPYSRLLQTVMQHRYATFAVAFSVLIICVGLVAGRRIDVISFPKMDSDFFVAYLKMPVGTPAKQTEATLVKIENIVKQLPDVRQYYTLVGGQISMETPELKSTQPYVGQILVELIPMEKRSRTSEEILNVLREKTSDIAGIDSLEFETMGGPAAGADIAIEIKGDRLEDILPAVEDVKGRLAKLAGVYDIRDDFEAGQREIKINLLPSARMIGLTTEMVSQQIRSAFYGITARTIQRGRKSVDIVVRYDLMHRNKLSDIERLRISTPAGKRVPLTEIARLYEGIGYAAIRHTDGQRAVTIYASVDPARGNPDEIMDMFESQYSQIELIHPGISLASTGSRRENARAMSSIWSGFVIAVVLIYVLLACLFRSYIQPFIVMISIPMAFIGVVIGHLVMGYSITLLSQIGYVALAGIAVNDALILVDYANRKMRAGDNRFDALYQAGLRRLRPILLTSLTTILGLAPLMAERSFQARFLIPMAISITFGLAVATLLNLLLVPALYLIFEDVRSLFRFRH